MRIRDAPTAKYPTRDDRHLGSFKINTETGKWANFAIDKIGDDLSSLVAYLRGISAEDAAQQLAAEMDLQLAQQRPADACLF